MQTETHEGRSLRIRVSPDEATTYQDSFRDHENRPATLWVHRLNPTVFQALLDEIEGHDPRLGYRPGVVVEEPGGDFLLGLDYQQWRDIRRLRLGE